MRIFSFMLLCIATAVGPLFSAPAEEQSEVTLPGTWQFDSYTFESADETALTESDKRGAVAMTKELLDAKETWVISEDPASAEGFLGGDRRFIEMKLEVYRRGKLRSRGRISFKKFKYFEYTLEKFPDIIYRCGLRKFEPQTFAFAVGGEINTKEGKQYAFTRRQHYVFKRVATNPKKVSP